MSLSKATDLQSREAYTLYLVVEGTGENDATTRAGISLIINHKVLAFDYVIQHEGVTWW